MGFIVHPSKWEVDHARVIFAGQAYQASHDGQLPETAMWKRLEFRRELNPDRFERWHPNIALMLEQRDVANFRISTFGGPRDRHRQLRFWDLKEVDRSADAPPTALVVAPPPFDRSMTTSTTPPRSADVSAVPEPATALQGMTAVMLAAAYFARRRRLRKRRK